MVNSLVNSEVSDVKGIINRIRKRDFSGNEGILIKNSTWQVASTLVSKIGSLIFTIILARLMLPEIYGLYGLAVSTILFLGVFSDLGIVSAIKTFVSRTIDKNPGKSKAYFSLLNKYRVFVVLISMFLIFLLASWFANDYYQKPIYYALIAGLVYLPLTIFSGQITPIFLSINNFKPIFIKEIIIEISRITLVPIVILLFLHNVSTDYYLFWIIIILSFCYLLGGLYVLWLFVHKNPFKNVKKINLNKKEKQELRRYILPLSATALSGIFFSSIDKIMLGHYVESQFVGFYQASFNLIASGTAIIAFASFAVFPIFARLKGKRLQRALKKTQKATFLVSIPTALFTFVFAPFIIRFIYGGEYLTSIIYLRVFSILMISFPLIKLYSSYYLSQKRTAIYSVILIISTIINIVLNYVFINIGITHFSMSGAVIGACLATIIARASYLFMLMGFKNKKLKKQMRL